MTTTSQTRANEAKLRERANAHPRDSEQAERLLAAAEELREIADRRDRHGWPR